MHDISRERETTLKFGLFSVNSYATSYPATAVEIAQLAESAGFESIWAGDIVVLSRRQMCSTGSILVSVELPALFPTLWLGSPMLSNATTAPRHLASLRSASRRLQEPSRWSVPD